MTSMEYEVIVVGGGLSGLAAADKLSKQGLKVLVLEASDRFGGRTLTVRSEDGGAHDLGGRWLAPSQHLMHALCAELGISVRKQHTGGYAIMHPGGAGSVRKYHGTVPPIPILSQLEPAKDLLDVAVRMVWGCECRDISLLFALHYSNVAGGFAQLVDAEGAAQDSYIEGGAQQLSERLAARVAGRKGCACISEAPVYQIDHGGELGGSGEDGVSSKELGETGVAASYERGASSNGPEPSEEGASLKAGQCETESGSHSSHPASNNNASEERGRNGGAIVHSAKGAFRAKAVIVAVPPTMIIRHISFFPPLPLLQEQIGSRYFMGSYTKAVVCYPTPFWREKGFSGEAMAAGYSREHPVLMSFDVSGEGGAYAALACFITGALADDHGGVTEEEQRAGVVRSLVRFFGEEARAFTELHLKVWADDLWTKGCPVNLAPPGVTCKYAGVLRKPIGCLHWAATETSTRWLGYMEGALEAGYRAAGEVEQWLSKVEPK
ncbi:amine oxidase [Klebsormidium nitens]|uniref:monoamine oxidase n=1 Tax=Klebsormidium nitens TaxID=105231 RepID=A0A1Y1I6Y5_KLENI|nr:amine oxidase [Klebsormidium nitens]|eukprot:GAQ85189.1 amine oxidase [Klebsormidium nitens]